MFTDIVGYSRLMEENEQRTIEILQSHNRIVLPAVSRGNGEVVDAIGDGLLVIYGSAYDAVQSALEVHGLVEEHNRAADPEMRFKLRIGINIGDIWQENDRVYGNGVNVAARVQPYAQPGGICITEDVHTQVANKLDVPIESIGRPALKNISRSVTLYRVATGYESNESDSASSEIDAHGDSDTEGPTLDSIKERLIAEKEKISRSRARLDGEHRNEAGQGRREEPKGRDLGTTIENGVYRLVEGIMDRAIDRWEHMPEEDRKRAEREIRKEFGKGGASDHGERHVGSGRGSGSGPGIVISTNGTVSKKNGDEEDKEGKGGGDLSLGLTMLAGFGLGYFYFGVGWMIWPLLLVGVLPTASGAYKMIRNYVRSRREARSRPQRLEQEVLRIARELDGRVTVVQVASRTSAPLDEIQQTLDAMTAKGYVSQNILDSGVIEYEFPSMR